MKTSELARLMNVQAESIRTSLYRRGDYYGIRPRRLPNGRLDWPDAEVRKLLQDRGGEPKQAA